jgi:glycosyltransferase involved in cell wall biosynthesis
VLVDPHDRDAIAQAIISLLANPAQALAMGAAGRERALLHFTPEAIAGDALDTMAKLLQETGLPERD